MIFIYSLILTCIKINYNDCEGATTQTIITATHRTRLCAVKTKAKTNTVSFCFLPSLCHLHVATAHYTRIRFFIISLLLDFVCCSSIHLNRFLSNWHTDNERRSKLYKKSRQLTHFYWRQKFKLNTFPVSLILRPYFILPHSCAVTKNVNLILIQFH